MLKPTNKNDKRQPFAVLDIETDESGVPILFGWYDGSDFVTFYEANHLVEHLIRSPYDRVYAHAGMNFDYSLLLKSLLSYGQMTIAYSRSQGLFAEFNAYGRSITLADSYRLLPLSLRKATDKFVPEFSKLQLDCMPWELDDVQLREYLERDCISLYLLIKRFFKFVEDEYGVCDKSLTLPALSLKIFKRHFLKHEIMTSNKKLYEFEKDSYFGGCCWVRPGEYDRVRSYDVNSMYPFHMVGDFPVSYVGAWTSSYKGRGLFRGRFRSPSDIPFIYDLESRQLATEGEAILDNETIEYLRSLGGEFTVSYGYIYYHWYPWLREFSVHFYEKKKEADEPHRTLYKLILNSLYGKFGQRRVGRKLATEEPNKLYKAYPIEISPGEFREIFDFEESRVVQHSFPVVSSLITLRSRVHLHKLLTTDGVGYPIYCDTDSVHFAVEVGDRTLECTEELGGLKLEAEGRGVYVAKKVYQLGDKIRCKGIPPSAIATELAGSGFEGIYSPRTFTYDSFPSIAQQLRGHQFARQSLTRTINFGVLES